MSSCAYKFQHSFSCATRIPTDFCVCEYVKIITTLGIATADSTRIICTLAHLGWTQGTHHHSTESLPSFLTGLETQKKEKERKLERRTALLHSGAGSVLAVISAEIIEVLKLLLVLCSPSLPLLKADVSLERHKQSLHASEALFEQEESSESTHAVQLTHRCTLPLYGS